MHTTGHVEDAPQCLPSVAAWGKFSETRDLLQVDRPLRTEVKSEWL